METQEYPRNSQLQNTSALWITEAFIAQVFGEIEGGITKKLFQDVSRTESRILGALSKFNDFLLNLEVRTISGIVPGTLQNADVKNQENT